MTITPAQAVAQVDSPRHDWDELSDHYKRHCREVAAAAIAAHKVLEADVPLAQPEYMPPAPSFHPERDGTLGEVEVGDRVMWRGRWREVLGTHDVEDYKCCVRLDDVGQIGIDQNRATVRIQKRATTDEGPPAEMRLPSGDVAYQTIRAGEVVPGMWVERHGTWHQVTHVTPFGEWRIVFGLDNDHGFGAAADDKVKVASTVDGAHLAAERKAMQAEAYDTACEART